MYNADDIPYAMIAPRRLVRLGLIAAGITSAGFGLLADVIGLGGSPGMGLKQWLLVFGGAALILIGTTDRAKAGRIRSRFLTWARDYRGALTAGQIAAFAATLGLATGLVETMVLVIDRATGGAFLRVGPHIVWMAPLLNAIILTAVGLILATAGRFWRKLVTPQVVVFILLLLAADTVLHRIRLQSRLTGEAKLILVLAVTTVLMPVMVRRLSSPTFFRRAVVVAGAVVLILGGAAALAPRWTERRAFAALPPAQDGMVSVIFIILDTVRAASLSLYGAERPTSPELARFAARGVTFEQAVAPSSWTLPSHATMFTARHPGEVKVDWLTPLGDRYPTLAEVLSREGFVTAGFSANVGYVSKESGLARGFARFEDFVATPGEMVRTSVMLARVLGPFGRRELVADDNRGRRSAEDINEAFLSWHERRPEGRPYFAFLNYYDAHAPFFAAPPFDTLFGGPIPHSQLPPWGPRMRKDQVGQWIDAYDRSLMYLDAQLGQLFRELDRRGALDGTVVVVTSDHGELLGEHSFMGHATTLYRQVLEVPLVVRGPGIPAGVRVKNRVALRDLPATLLELAGAPNDGKIPGRSFAAAWRSDTVRLPVLSELGRGLRIPRHYPNARNDLWSVFDRDVHYIVSSNGTEQFYDLTTDPAEERNLAARGTVPDEMPALRAIVTQHRAQTVRPGPLGSSPDSAARR
jgi:arylsulfatase A-like enzyme